MINFFGGGEKQQQKSCMGERQKIGVQRRSEEKMAAE